MPWFNIVVGLLTATLQSLAYHINTIMALMNLQTLHQQFDQLEPLPAQFSPGMKKSYSKILKAINNCIAQVSDASSITTPNLNPVTGSTYVCTLHCV